MLVGEQPGDREDRAGRPFVGPAGRILDAALESAEVSRDDVYVTNAVKHFKWRGRGKKRIHDKPGRREVRACLPWLATELAAVDPAVIVLLGATAAQALLGAEFRLTRDRGRPFPTEDGRPAVATVHPSWVLRARLVGERDERLAVLAGDLRTAVALALARH